jgi:hypothetical protein
VPSAAAAPIAGTLLGEGEGRMFVIPSVSRGIPRRYLKAFATGSFDLADASLRMTALFYLHH